MLPEENGPGQFDLDASPLNYNRLEYEITKKESCERSGQES